MLLTPHYPWYYLALVPFLTFYTTSWTLWVVTVGGFQTYQFGLSAMIPGYDDRQILFHGLVLLAIARDLWLVRPQGTPDLKRDTLGNLLN